MVTVRMISSGRGCVCSPAQTNPTADTTFRNAMTFCAAKNRSVIMPTNGEASVPIAMALTIQANMEPRAPMFLAYGTRVMNQTGRAIYCKKYNALKTTRVLNEACCCSDIFPSFYRFGTPVTEAHPGTNGNSRPTSSAVG